MFPLRHRMSSLGRLHNLKLAVDWLRVHWKVAYYGASTGIIAPQNKTAQLLRLACSQPPRSAKSKLAVNMVGMDGIEHSSEALHLQQSQQMLGSEQRRPQQAEAIVTLQNQLRTMRGRRCRDKRLERVRKVPGCQASADRCCSTMV